MKKIVSVLVIVVAVVLLSREFRLAERLGLVESRESKLRILRENAAKYNAQMPKPVDPETLGLAMDVTPEGVVFRYRMVNHTRQQLADAGFAERLKPMLLENACKDKNTLVILRNRFSVTYAYVDKADAPVTTVVVTPEQCR